MNKMLVEESNNTGEVSQKKASEEVIVLDFSAVLCFVTVSSWKDCTKWCRHKRMV